MLPRMVVGMFLLFSVGKECLEDLKNSTIWSAAPLPYINGLGLEMHLPLMTLIYLLFC